MRATTLSTYILAPLSRIPPSGTPLILPIPLPTSSLYLPLPSTDHRAGVLEAVLLPRKRLCIAPGPRFEVVESSSAATARSTGGFRVDYDFVVTLDAEIRRDPDREVGYRNTDIWVDPVEVVEEIPPTTLLNMLRKDRRYHANTTLLVENEARVTREACAQSIDASHRVRSEVMTLRTIVSALQTENEELRRIKESDRLTQHIQHEHDRFRDFQRTRDVAPEEADSSS
ncbi:hypothetical protein Tco_0093008 [Tanacetum coccineum]